MSVTRRQHHIITLYRQVFFGSPAGKMVVGDMLHRFGLFDEPDALRQDLRADPAVAEGLLAGLKLLQDLGVWLPEQKDRIIEALAALPLPEIEETPHGEISR